MEKPEFYLEAEIKKANQDLTICQKVSDTLATAGWKDIIEPLIDKTIMDITGGKIGDKWYGGLIDKARKDERREYYIGYKQAMIDFNRRIMAYRDGVKMLQDKANNLKKNKEEVRYKLPLVDDTKYGMEKEL